tara:strand:+ start:1005 stop:1901 length:897 start_codon:yes stop_codon:yes gene_type:complete
LKTKNLTVVTCSKDRHENLNSLVDDAQKINGFNKHIIIDWSSKTKINNLDIVNNNIEIFEVDNESSWWLTRAYNTAFNLVETKYILKIDADIKINTEKINKIQLEKYDLIIFREEGNNYDNGNFFVKNKLIQDVNGFNEYIWGWGWDDNDLIERIKEIRKDLNILYVSDGIKKIQHDNAERSKYIENNVYKNKELFSYSKIKAHNDANAYLSKLKLWTSRNKLIYVIKNKTIYLKHFYSLKDINIYYKISFKYIFLKSFFKIYKDKKRFQKRILPLLLILLPNQILDKFLFLDFYPKS